MARLPHLSPDDLQRLRRAAEDAAYLVGRGYAGEAVADFVAGQLALSPAEQRLLSASARASACVRHHIARELDADDVARRPLRVDAASVLACVETALGGGALLESMAGVLVDPAWSRASYQPGDGLAGALERVAATIQPLRPSRVCWLIERGAPHAEPLSRALAATKKIGRAPAEIELVDDVPAALASAPFVASAELAVLDACGTWINLPALALADRSPTLIRLH